MIMKRLLPLAMCVFLLSGCSGASEPSQKKDDTAAQTTTSEQETVTEETIVPKVIEYDPDKPVIALTFDDGPNTSITPRVLDLLEKYDAAGTFFLIGQNVNEQSAESAKRAYSLGCEIENHSYTHSYMDKMTADEINGEMEKTNELITDITGTEPQFFRPPYLAANDIMYENIDMTFISGFGVNDWDSKVTTDERVDGVLKLAQDGAIILLHDADGNYQTVEALDTIIPKLQKQGYQLVTLSQLFEAKGKSPSDEEFRNRIVSIVN